MNGTLLRILSSDAICAEAAVTLGCAAMTLIPQKAGRFVQAVRSCTVGFLISSVCFSFLPQAFALDGFWGVFFSMVSGALTMLLWQEMTKQASLIFAVIALYMFAEGLLVGCGFFAAAKVGSFKMTVFAAQYFLFGVAVSAAKKEKHNAILLVQAVLCALAKGAGNLIGAQIGSLYRGVTTLVLSFSSGGILYGCFAETLYTLCPRTTKKSVMAVMVGIFAGLVLAFV